MSCFCTHTHCTISHCLLPPALGYCSHHLPVCCGHMSGGGKSSSPKGDLCMPHPLSPPPIIVFVLVHVIYSLPNDSTNIIIDMPPCPTGISSVVSQSHSTHCTSRTHHLRENGRHHNYTHSMRHNVRTTPIISPP